MQRDRIRQKIIELAEQRGPGKTFCPSEVARSLADDWRSLMPSVRAAAGELADEGRVSVYQQGEPVEVNAVNGPIRIGLPQ